MRARSRLDDKGHRCRGCRRCRHCNIHRADVGSGAGALRRCAGLCAANRLGRARPAGYLDGRNRHALQRPAKYANKEFFTEAERAELDQQRAAALPATSARSAGPARRFRLLQFRVFSAKRSGFVRRGSSIRPMAGSAATPEAQKAAADREFASP